MTVRIALAGAGAFGLKHLDGLREIGAEVTWLIDNDPERARTVGEAYGVRRTTADLAEALASPDVDAVILATPTPLHAVQALACLQAGKHVQIEIPAATRLVDAEAILAAQRAGGLTAMVGHTRRFNPSHQYLHRKIMAGDLSIQQMDVQTYFLRRSNINALGQPRTWTDHLLWHHAAHTVDLFAFQAGEITAAHALEGPVHPDLGIAMDLSIQLKSASGALCTLSLSFSNDGPIGSTFRYIGDTGSWVVRYDDLVTGAGAPVDLTGVASSMNGIVLQDREFISAIEQSREPEAGIGRVIACYRTLDKLERQLMATRPGPAGRETPAEQVMDG